MHSVLNVCYLSCMKGSRETVRTLMFVLTDCTYIVIYTTFFHTISQSGRTALHHAALHGHDTVLNLLLKVPNCPIQ